MLSPLYGDVFLYMIGLVITINSDIRPRRVMITSSSMSADRNSPRMSNTATSWPSYVSMVAVISTDSRDTVGDVASYLSETYRCFRPSVHALPFMVTSLFYFINRRYSKAYVFCCSVMSAAYSGFKVSFICICIISFDKNLSLFS